MGNQAKRNRIPGGKGRSCVVFVILMQDTARLSAVTQQVIAAFPGSVIYQHRDPMRAVCCVHDHPADAVFADAALACGPGGNLTALLRRCQPALPVVAIGPGPAPGCDGVIPFPVTAQTLREALRPGILQGGTAACSARNTLFAVANNDPL